MIYDKCEKVHLQPVFNLAVLWWNMAQFRNAQKIRVKSSISYLKKNFNGLGTVTMSQMDTQTGGVM
jgi:hypothetical protein